MSERATKRPLSSPSVKYRIKVKNVKVRHFIMGAGAIMNTAEAVASPRLRPILRRSPFTDVLNLSADGARVHGYLRKAFERISPADLISSRSGESAKAFEESKKSNNSEIQLALFAS